MKFLNRKILWIIVAVVLIVLIAINLFQYQRIAELSVDYPRTISEIKESPESYLGRKVTVEGYLVKISGEYMLIEALDLLLVNKDLLKEQYLLIRGLEDNKTQESIGRLVRTRGTIKEEEGQVNLDFDPSIPIFVVGYDKPAMKYQHLIYDITQLLAIKVGQIQVYNPNYAVLISGGGNAPWSRYWYDLKLVYSILVANYSYNPNRITVIYKDGVGKDNDIPVDFAASEANVNTVFQNLAEVITNEETLFVFTTNHGGGFNPNDPYGVYMYGLIDNDGDEPEAGYSEQAFGKDFNNDGDTQDTHSVDETLVLYPGGQRIRDDDFAALINNINSFRTIIVMEQCFSGGFISDLSGTNTIVLTACHEEEFSYAADTEGSFDEFAYHFSQAINTSNMAADTDNDGRISMQEAFNYASQNDSQNEQPQYDDNGDGVGHQEPIPNGGDGALGDTTFLEP